jgi:anti-sigma regulatory factor (Ser/Thr protein kinase)
MDGAAERARSERIRSGQLREKSEQLSQRVVDNLRRYQGPPFGDAGDTFRLRLARIRPAVALLRHDLSRWLEYRGVDSNDINDIALACSEACANAVEHPVCSTDRAFVVEAIHRDDRVEIVVRDSGRWRSAPAVDTRGRGTQMIRNLMSDVEVVHEPEGTAVVMRRYLDPPRQVARLGLN